jgi:hypothetical protein
MSDQYVSLKKWELPLGMVMSLALGIYVGATWPETLTYKIVKGTLFLVVIGGSAIFRARGTRWNRR